MRQLKNGTRIWSGDDIADALGMHRNTPCARCRHGRYDHNHGTGARKDLERLGSCQAIDNRTTTNLCKCEHFEVTA